MCYMAEAVDREGLPLDIVALLELAAELLLLGDGESRLEVIFHEGVLRHCWRHEQIDRLQLAERYNVRVPRN